MSSPHAFWSGRGCWGWCSDAAWLLTTPVGSSNMALAISTRSLQLLPHQESWDSQIPPIPINLHAQPGAPKHSRQHAHARETLWSSVIMDCGRAENARKMPGTGSPQPPHEPKPAAHRPGLLLRSLGSCDTAAALTHVHGRRALFASTTRCSQTTKEPRGLLGASEATELHALVRDPSTLWKLDRNPWEKQRMDKS